MKLNYRTCSALVCLALAQPLSAQAAGFYLQESSVSSLGSAFAGSTVRIDDASTVFFNPAGMTDLERKKHVSAGVHILSLESNIEDNGTSNPPSGTGAISGSDSPYGLEEVPNFYFAAPTSFNEKMWFGFGVNAPFGLKNEYDEDWFGRYDSTKTDLQVINYSGVLAYEVNDKLSIGGGIDIQDANATLEAAARATKDGLSVLTGDDVSWGYNVGLTYKPQPGTEIGAHYRSAITHELEGYIGAFGTGGADFRAAGRAGLDLPDILTLGAAHDLDEKWTIMGQFTWFGWNNFDAITATTDESVVVPSLGKLVPAGDQVSSVKQAYQNTIAIAVGAEYAYSDKWTLRAGYQFDETPTTDEYRTTRTPDGDRNWLTLGATYNINDQVALDMAAAYINVAKEDISLSRNGSGALESSIEATNEADIGIFSIGFNYKF